MQALTDKQHLFMIGFTDLSSNHELVFSTPEFISQNFRLFFVLKFNLSHIFIFAFFEKVTQYL